MRLTITEALAEARTIGKRIEAKRSFIGVNLGRPEGLKDPHAKEGGAEAALQAAFQAIDDLEVRLVAIRTEIQRSNFQTFLTIEDLTLTITEWLAWWSEVATKRQAFLLAVIEGIRSARRQTQERGAKVVRPGDAEASMSDLILHVDEASIRKAAERMDTILGTLDGRLSLLNATTFVEIP